MCVEKRLPVALRVKDSLYFCSGFHVGGIMYSFYCMLETVCEKNTYILLDLNSG